MSPIDLVEREEDLDGVRLRLPAPQTRRRALGRLALVIATGVGGFVLATIIGGVMAAWTGLWPLVLLGFGGIWAGLVVADTISEAVLPILAPVHITLGSHHMVVRHGQRTHRVALSEIADLDGVRHRLLARDGRLIPIAPQQPTIVRDWVLLQVSAWVAARLDEQGRASEVPAALRAINDAL